MFSRNRFHGQHGASVSPKGGTKTKKRAPNPRVALVIRGKIHRLLQGSADHHVPDSQLYYPGVEEEHDHTSLERRKEQSDSYETDDHRAEAFSPKLSNGKSQGLPPGPPCIGEVELNREGCIKIPCTLKHKSGRSSGIVKRISFESGIPESPEQRRRTPSYNPVASDMNGTKFIRGMGRAFASPRVRQRRPYSTGDCIDFNFKTTLPNILLEEDEDGKEEESSAIIDHILKELRGINKIQEEISDLRDYLTSVRGSVEEVSSCVDAVLLEIEGIRSNSKAASDSNIGTWSSGEDKDEQYERRRPASAYGSLGCAMPLSDSSLLPEACSDGHTFQRGLPSQRPEQSTVSPIPEVLDQHDLDDQDDTSDHSSDIPVSALTRKPSFGYLERQDGHDCPSTSSLSSCHSSKSESDSERPSSSHGKKPQRPSDDKWTSCDQPQRSSGGITWKKEYGYADETLLCCEGTASWDQYRDSEEYERPERCSSASSAHRSVRSRQRYNSPASSLSKEQWKSPRCRPHTHPSISTPADRSYDGSTLRCEYSTDYSYPKSSGYHSMDRQDVGSKRFSYEQQNVPVYRDHPVDPYQGAFEPQEESSAVIWTEASPCVAAEAYSLQTNEYNQSVDSQLPAGDDLQAGFNVKSISRAVFDFSSALRGALRKLEVPASQNPEEQTDYDISMRSDLHTDIGLDCEAQFLKAASLSEVCLSKTSTLDRTLPDEEAPLTLEPADSKISMSTDDTQLCPQDISISCDTRSVAPPPDPLTGQPVDVCEDWLSEQNNKTLLSQCSTTESLSLVVDGPMESQALQDDQAPGEPAVDLAVAPESKGDVEASESDFSQLDERKLKCLRSFQQILREKRESRRNLSSVTMYTFSQDETEPGIKSY
ncbi:uncharacterized protein ACB058_006728 [Synchiropus picturatus]